ncbi:MAG: cytochrome c biogenesis protein CcdA [Anaerolineaceae bacterium]|nr:cytochrome c biogenesis protein CcdA [Anaerolineaceae bacterium]
MVGIDVVSVSAGLAFLAGLASFLSPCVFSLVPAYVGYLGGRSLAASQGEDAVNRWETLLHGVAFVLGFSLVFVILGVAVSALGGLLYDLRSWISKIGGLVVILFGLHLTGLFRTPFLDYELRPQTRMHRNRSFLSSALMGVFFSAGWSPCVGPVLGTILTLVLNGGSIIDGAQMLGAYSAGLAVPFLLAALGLGWVNQALRRYRRSLHFVEIVMGGVLIVVGILLFSGTFEQLARFGFFIDFGL